jgi:hypothetical protein
MAQGHRGVCSPSLRSAALGSALPRSFSRCEVEQDSKVAWPGPNRGLREAEFLTLSGCRRLLQPRTWDLGKASSQPGEARSKPCLISQRSICRICTGDHAEVNAIAGDGVAKVLSGSEGQGGQVVERVALDRPGRHWRSVDLGVGEGRRDHRLGPGPAPDVVRRPRSGPPYPT